MFIYILCPSCSRFSCVCLLVYVFFFPFSSFYPLAPFQPSTLFICENHPLWDEVCSRVRANCLAFGGEACFACPRFSRRRHFGKISFHLRQLQRHFHSVRVTRLVNSISSCSRACSRHFLSFSNLHHLALRVFSTNAYFSV